MTDKQPNIVFFFWDNFGWGSSAAMGAECCAARHAADRRPRR